MVTATWTFAAGTRGSTDGNVVVYLRMKGLVPPSSEKMSGMKMP